MIRSARLRKCKVCSSTFTPFSSAAKVCGVTCAVSLGDQIKAKKDRAETRAKKEALKTRSDYLPEAQSAVNAYVRARDAHLPCISCGRFHQGQWHAGHYKSVGAHPELRFNELNIHRQCQPCNTHKSGNVLEYRKGLIAKIGIELVEWLEGPHEAKKYSIDELKAIKAEYRAKTKQLQGKAA
jgi:hypothetical protein